MRTFQLHRDVDASGVSGTGVVAEGVEFESGECVLHWLSKHSTLGIYPDIKALKTIHGHEGMTRVVWMQPKKRRRAS